MTFKLSKTETQWINKFFKIIKKKIFNPYEYLPFNEKNKQFSKNIITNNILSLIAGFVIKIIFKKSNIFIQINNFCGHTLAFSSVKRLIQKGSLKINTEEIFKIIYKIILENKKHLKQNNVVLQIITNDFNLNSFNYFIDQISGLFPLVKLEFLKNYAFNGCRKKKSKRK